MTRVQECVFLLCDPLLPSRFYASGSSLPCVNVSPALTQFLGTRFRGLEFSPSSIPLLPDWAGPGPPQPPQVISKTHLGLLGSLEVWTGSLTELLGRGGETLLAGILLWPLKCEPPATSEPPSFSVAAGLSASSSMGQMTQACNLMET